LPKKENKEVSYFTFGLKRKIRERLILLFSHKENNLHIAIKKILQKNRKINK